MLCHSNLILDSEKIIVLVLEAAAQRCSAKKVVCVGVPQNSQDNTCTRVFLIKLHALGLRLY